MLDIFPVFQYTKDLKELDGKIIECAWDGKQWIYMRQRTDKSFPNSIKTAEGRPFYVQSNLPMQSPVLKVTFFLSCHRKFHIN